MQVLWQKRIGGALSLKSGRRVTAVLRPVRSNRQKYEWHGRMLRFVRKYGKEDSVFWKSDITSPV
jgi:hypothetical protein